MGRRKLETRESVEARCLSGSYPGVGSLAERVGTPLGRLGPGGSDHNRTAPPNWLKFCCLLRPREVNGHHDIHLANEVGLLGGCGWEVPPAHARCPQIWGSCFFSGPLGALEPSGLSTRIQFLKVSSEETWLATPVSFCSVLKGMFILAGQALGPFNPSSPGSIPSRVS